jgi:peptidyl-Asp metalloendopeptidase
MQIRRELSSSTSVVIAVVTALILTDPVYAQQGNSLFIEGLPLAADAGELAQSVRSELARTPGFVDAKIVQNQSLEQIRQVLQRASTAINSAAADKAEDQLVINLFGGRTIRVVGRSSSSDLEQGRWFGDVVAISDSPPGGPLGSVSMNVRDGRILGTISLPQATYEIRPAAERFTAIIQIDTSFAPPDHPPPARRFRGGSRQDPAPIPPADPNTTYTIRMLVVYTANAKKTIEGPRAAVTVNQWVDQRVNEANQSFVNSKINLRMELGQIIATNYTEAGDWDKDRDRFFTNNDGFMDEVFGGRDSAKADIAVLLFDNQTYCGEAMAIRAGASSAFAVVDVTAGCTLKFTFTHEVGHLIGAEHNLSDASDPPSYPWAHGYINGNSWRTMMAYQKGCSPCTRLPYWSSPLITYGGAAMGTADKEDNARVLRENSRSVSEFR